MNKDERRSHERISEVVTLRFSKFENSLQNQEPSGHEVENLLPDLMKKIDLELAHLQPRLQRVQSVFAQAVELLDRKIQLLALNRTHEEIDLGETELSLSAGGIAFSCRESVEPGTMLGLSLHLDNGDQPIQLLGRTVACEARTGSTSIASYWLRVAFSDTDQAMCLRLAEHITKKSNALEPETLFSSYSKVSKSSAYNL